MAVLKYEDLVADVEREQVEKGLEFVAKDGKTVLLRPILLLSKDELAVVRGLLPTVTNNEADPFDRIDAIGRILVAASDKKDSLKKSLADLPPHFHTRIFDDWMKAAKSGEASA
ncbi:hypothetical protein Ssi03_12840 [Sphaerisporangium siamense]|uniref:Uncharacterized protein n=1 Tax=Sphaerisporangium siamense TaxID=795645 RepID=A0A7W7D9W5_9ACTN|nr:hypothetical protein [Sphaerisporangium siamense]MBB4702947.1 hypothetical protein [Sphaerisporangium siamense]GII83294.1 hypothetical protein Ssi03_12840 [Sphaerisporangium siamense]